MKKFFSKNWRGSFSLALIFWLGLSLMGAGSVSGEVTSGMSLGLFTDEENYPQRQYLLGIDAIEIILVVKNKNAWAVSTDRGFSQVDLHQSLILTDPNGTKHALSQDEEVVLDVLPAISWNNRPTSEAESLAADWVRSVTIDDLRVLFPMLNSQPGWYTLEAHQPFVRFAWTVQAEPVGLLGVQDDPYNWSGTIDSEQLQIFIAPASGGQIETLVMDNSLQEPGPLDQIPVRVFKKSDLPSTYLPEEEWSKTKSILEGTTNPQGLAVWDSEEEVVCLAEAEYVVMARYLDEVKEAAIATGAASGWATGCEGLVSAEIYYGEPPDDDGGIYSVFALDSVWLRPDAVVNSGDVATNSEGSLAANCDGSPACAGQEIVVDERAYAHDGVRLLGDSILIRQDASVFDILCNELENYGIIRGQQTTPLSLPVWTPPEFVECTPGTTAVSVTSGQTQTLTPGAFANVIVDTNATLKLAAGTYHINYLELKIGASLVSLGPVKVLIKTRFECDQDNYVGPQPGSEYTAKDMVFYVGGVDETADEYAVEIDNNSIIKANFYCPNGTLYSEADCQLEGSFIGKDVQIGIRTTVTLNSAFGGRQAPGDYDGDGDYDGKDLAAFAAAYALRNTSADLNKDGSVNSADVSYFAARLGQAASSPAAPMAEGGPGAITQAATTDGDTDKKLKKKKNKRNKNSRKHKRRKKNK